MASAATNIAPPVNLSVKTVAEYPNQYTQKKPLTASLSATLYTTPSILGHRVQNPNLSESVILSNRYRLSAYVALTQRSQTAPGFVGPLAVTWDDGNGSKTAYIGFNPLNPLNGQGSQNALSSGQTHSLNINSVFAGEIQFVAAPGTAITISLPVDGQISYIPNIALETF